MHLTVAGERLLARCRPLLDGLRAAEYELRAGGNAIEGRRQVSPAVRVLREFLAERVTAMVKA
jgi:DNA-binding transcriptional LysR family regulator